MNLKYTGRFCTLLAKVSTFAAVLNTIVFRMNHFKSACTALLMAVASPAVAGGILTNTNQNVAFDRMFSRDAAIGIDGVYSNPAGVAFMKDGHHLSLNWQLVFQSRTINNDFPLFANNTENPTTPRAFKGKAFAPVLPSIQYAYNWHNFSFQANFGVTGGGGKCKFDNGLGSFERIVGETALGAIALAQAVDGVTGTPMFSSEQMFGTTGSYSFNSYMRGRQYYYSLSLGAAYKLLPTLSLFAGVRGVYAQSNYFGFVRDIKVGNVPLYTLLDPSKTNSADIELNCDQSGRGFTPIVGIDYKLGRWNLAVKYEFKTRMHLKNSSVNQAPSIGNLPENLVQVFTAQGMPVEQAMAIMGSPTVSASMSALKAKFDEEMDKATGEYADGKKVANDIPALLTFGVAYNPIDPLRINAGFHYFFDKQASSYQHREDKLKRGTMEWSAGAELDACKLVTVSAGWQNTSYGLSDDYMDDKSFVVSSNSVGAGVCIHLSDDMDLNVAYFHSFYKHKKTSETMQLTPTVAVNYDSDYTRNNNVFGVGLDINF